MESNPTQYIKPSIPRYYSNYCNWTQRILPFNLWIKLFRKHQSGLFVHSSKKQRMIEYCSKGVQMIIAVLFIWVAFVSILKK